MAEDELKGISEDTKAMLEGQVKKGKARKFILICKGASIKTLIVFKKGPFGPKIMQAKKEGFKGEAFCGVIIGKGVSLTMQLAGNSAVADAMKTEGSVCEGEPCKIAKLRQFFKDEGDLKFKPEFAIITQVGEVVSADESDDDEAADAAASEAPEDTSPEASAAPAAADAGMAAKLAQAVKQLKPLMEQVIAAQPDRKAALVAQMTEIVQQLKASQFQDAKTNIVEFGKLLKQLAATPAGDAAATAEPAAPNAGADALAAKLTEALSKMTPLIKQALAASPARKAEILEPAAAIKALIAQAQVADAKTRLVEYSQFLKGLTATPPEAPPPPPPPPTAGDPSSAKASEWEWRLKEVTPQLKRVLTEKLGNFSQIAATFKQAQGLKDSDITQAVELLKTCSTLIRDALQPAEERVPEDTGDERQDWLDRISFFPNDLKELKDSGVAESGTVDLDFITSQHESAKAKAEQGDYVTAHQLQNEVDRFMEEARAAMRSADAFDKIADGKVAFSQALLRWQAAFQSAEQELATVQEAMIEEEPDHARLAADLSSVLVDFEDRLDDVLIAGMNAQSDEERKPRHQEAVRLISEFESTTNSDPLIAHIDSFPLANVQLKQTLLSALKDVSAQLGC